ncbi:hypothetical protein Tco_1293341, partial [Tanacetum coccineum]
MVRWSLYASEEHLLQQGDNASGEDYEDIDWNTEDELDITPSSGPSSVTTVEPIVSNGEHLEESLDEINSCNQQQQCADDDSFNLSSDYDESPLNDISKSDSWSGSWFGSDAAVSEASIVELTFFYCVGQMSKTEEYSLKRETKTQVCLLCEVILKQIPAFNFFCASFESITAIEKLGKWVKEGEGNP